MVRKSDDVTVLAIDVGTSSLRTALFDGRGARVAGTLAQRAYPLRVAGDGTAVLEPGLLLRALRACLAATLEGKARAGGMGVAGVGISCFWHSLVGVDGNGRALTPVLTWADARCRADAQRLREIWDERQVHARTGCMLRSSFWPAKLAWLKRSHPALFKAVRRWMSPAEWLQEQLTGELGSCGYSMASGTGVFDGHRLRWDTEVLDGLGLDAERLNPLGEPPVRMSRAAARRFPRLAGTAWFPAIGDGAASNLGCHAAVGGVAAINIGTSAAVRVVSTAKQVKPPFGLFCYRIDGHRYLIGGAVSNAGNLRQWCVDQLKPLGGNPVALERALAKRSGPAHGLVVLPFWVSERAPTWPENLPSVVAGMTPATTALDLLQATTEAVYMRLAQIAEMLPGASQLRFVVSGGVQRSPSSLQRLADCLGRPVMASREAEASLRGAAVFALERLGRTPLALPAGRLFRPRPAIARAYFVGRKRQRQLEAILAKNWDQLGAL